MGRMHPDNWRRFTGDERRAWLASCVAALIQEDRTSDGRNPDPGSHLFGVMLGAVLKLNAAKCRTEA